MFYFHLLIDGEVHSLVVWPYSSTWTVFLKYSFYVTLSISNFHTHPREGDLNTYTHVYAQIVIAIKQYFIDF